MVFISSFARSIADGLSGDDDFAHVCINVLKVTMVGLSPASISILKSLNPLSTPKAVDQARRHKILRATERTASLGDMQSQSMCK